jgi:flagellar motor switch protein FliM
MTEVLSQQEIDDLLKAVNDIYADDEETSEYISTDRPNKFSREQVREISLVHENFARIAAKSLSNRLQRTFSLTVASVDQLFMGEFIRSIPSPTTLGVINVQPLNGSVLLEIDPAITFAIIDKMRGSDIVASKSWHELNDNEKFIMKRIYTHLLDDLRDAWYKTIELKPQLIEIETDPQFIKIAPPMEWVVLVTLEANMEGVMGMLNFCIPYPVIEPVLNKLSSGH